MPEKMAEKYSKVHFPKAWSISKWIARLLNVTGKLKVLETDKKKAKVLGY